MARISVLYDVVAIIAQSPLYRKYDLLFEALDKHLRHHRIRMPKPYSRLGRKGYSGRAILKALILRHLESIKSVPGLVRYLKNHPILLGLCGFRNGLPHESQFYRFLKSMPNSLFEEIHHAINQPLIDQGHVSLSRILADSKPVKAATRDNNPKNPRRKLNKHKKPKRNPDATLSYYSHEIRQGKKKTTYFWGYRTHVLVSREGVALVEITQRNNIPDHQVAKKLLRKLKRAYSVEKGFVFIADSGYDVRELYEFLLKKMKARPIIKLNPRGARKEELPLDNNGCPLCEAGLGMVPDGAWKDGDRYRRKFRCPLLARKQNTGATADLPDICPVQHEKYADGQGYGCTKYIDSAFDLRSSIDRNRKSWKKLYNLRTGVECYFARLGDREAEQTTHYSLRSVRNQMTIAHLSRSLVAYVAAIFLERPDLMCSAETLWDQAPKPGTRRQRAA